MWKIDKNMKNDKQNNNKFKFRPHVWIRSRVSSLDEIRKPKAEEDPEALAAATDRAVLNDPDMGISKADIEKIREAKKSLPPPPD